MIGRLQGTIVEQAGDGPCILDVNGVGYEVLVPARVRAGLAPAPHQVTLHIHTHVREDALLLFGFAALGDREAFRALIGVSGVGPRTALAILNAMTASELATAVARGDKNRLKAISGVGKKTAERLVLDLADKLPAMMAAFGGPAGTGAPLPASPGRSDPSGMVAGALVQMGFGRAEAERAAAQVVEPGRDVPAEELLRRALATLA